MFLHLPKRNFLIFFSICLVAALSFGHLFRRSKTAQKNLDSELFLAASVGHKELVEDLLAKGAKPYWRDAANNTTTTIGAERGHWPVVKVILTFEPHLIRSRGERNNTLLHIAVYQGNLDWIEFLVQKDRELLNLRNASGSTPLHHAAFTGTTPTIDTLLRLGADIEARNDYQETPLHVAAWAGRIDAARIFLKAGAAVDARAARGETALDYAIKRSHAEVEDLLSRRKPARAAAASQRVGRG